MAAKEPRSKDKTMHMILNEDRVALIQKSKECTGLKNASGSVFAVLERYFHYPNAYKTAMDDMDEFRVRINAERKEEQALIKEFIRVAKRGSIHGTKIYEQACEVLENY